MQPHTTTLHAPPEASMDDTAEMASSAPAHWFQQGADGSVGMVPFHGGNGNGGVTKEAFESFDYGVGMPRDGTEVGSKVDFESMEAAPDQADYADEGEGVEDAVAWLPPPVGLPPPPEGVALAVVQAAKVPRFFASADRRNHTQRLYEDALSEVHGAVAPASSKRLQRDTRMSLDTGLSLGRSFRASFGNNGMLVLPFKSHASMLAAQDALIGANAAPPVPGAGAGDDDDDDDYNDEEEAANAAQAAAEAAADHARACHAVTLVNVGSLVSLPSSLPPLGATFPKMLEAHRNASILETAEEDDGSSSGSGIAVPRFRLPRGAAPAQAGQAPAIDEVEYPQLAAFMHTAVKLTARDARSPYPTDMGSSGSAGGPLAEAEAAAAWATAQQWRLARAIWGQERTQPGTPPAVAAALQLPVTARCPGVGSAVATTAGGGGSSSNSSAGRLVPGLRRTALLQQWCASATRGRSKLPGGSHWREGTGGGELSRSLSGQGFNRGSSFSSTKAGATGVGAVLDALSEGRVTDATKLALGSLSSNDGGVGGGSQASFASGEEQQPQHPRLALAIASCGPSGGRESARLVAQQLVAWRQSGAWECVPPDLRLAYTLLAGTLGTAANPQAALDYDARRDDALALSSGREGEEEGDGGEYESGSGESCLTAAEARAVGSHLDWLRRLGCHLWFQPRPHRGPSALRMAFGDYQTAAARGNAAPPLPTLRARRWHAAAAAGGMGVGGDGADEGAAYVPGYTQGCVLFHLLELYCASSDSTAGVYEQLSFRTGLSQSSSNSSGGGCEVGALLAALDPRSTGSDPLDFRASWQLATLLQALGLHAVEAQTYSRVLHGLADQLESGGLWQWAVYVLQGLPESTRRNACVRSLVLRHAHEAPQGFANAAAASATGAGGFGAGLTSSAAAAMVGRADFLCGTLGLPRALLNEALANWANYCAATGLANLNGGGDSGNDDYGSSSSSPLGLSGDGDGGGSMLEAQQRALVERGAVSTVEAEAGRGLALRCQGSPLVPLQRQKVAEAAALVFWQPRLCLRPTSDQRAFLAAFLPSAGSNGTGSSSSTVLDPYLRACLAYLDLPNGSVAKGGGIEAPLDLAALEHTLATLVPALAAGRTSSSVGSAGGGSSSLLAAETWVGGACTVAGQEASEVYRLEMLDTARKLQHALFLHRAQTQAELAATEARHGGNPAAAVKQVWSNARTAALVSAVGVPEQSEAARRVHLAHATRAFVDAL